MLKTYTEQADYFRPDGPIYIFIQDNSNCSTELVRYWYDTGLGATLAGWARQKFPHLIDDVWSSSGKYEQVVHSSGIITVSQINVYVLYELRQVISEQA